MRKFQLNIKNGESHLFNSIADAYKWACQNVMTQGDIDYYQECSDIPLYEIQNEEIQEAVLRNVFENVIFSAWNDDGEGWENFAEFH